MRHIRSNRVNSRPLAVLLVVAGLALWGPAGAMAQSLNPTDEQYGSGIQGYVASGSSGDSVNAPASAGELPFTGLDVAAIAAIGIGLVGGGFVIRRAARSGGSGAIS